MTEAAIDHNASIPSPTPDPNKAQDVVNLSDRDIRWREKYKLTKSELEAEKIKVDRQLNDLTEKHKGELDTISQFNKQLQQKVIETKIEAEAVAAGLKDLDLLKLIDKEHIKLNEDGSISGISEAIKTFREKKPDYFGPEKKVSSSTNAPMPEANPVKENAWNMKDEDWQSIKKGVGLR